jgi:uncharacterized protein (UPF0276 family)
VVSSSARAREMRGPVPSAAGIGLRYPHHSLISETRPAIPWLEIHTENFMGGGAAPRLLDDLRRDYPVSLHGVGLSLGAAEGLDPEHLERVAAAVDRFAPALVSEHLSWSVVDGVYLADLLPLPLTEEALDVACRNVERAQERLGRVILVENPSSYVAFRHSTIPEWEFLAALSRRTGCGLLCDVNNIYVSASNHGWDASAYLRGLPISAIGEIHLAGHATRRLASGKLLRIDDHGSRVASEVWTLYAEALGLFGPVPTLIEWDTDIPPLDVLLAEAATAEGHLRRARGSRLCRRCLKFSA